MFVDIWINIKLKLDIEIEINGLGFVLINEEI